MPLLKFNQVVILLVIVGLLSGCDAYEIDQGPTSTPTKEQSLSEILTIVAADGPTYTPKITIPSETPNPTLEWMNEENRYGKVGVYIIVDAINRFYEDKGIYPDDLSELVPAYLGQLPSTITGKPFDYYQNDYEIYMVFFCLERRGGENSRACCSYTHRRELWECSWGTP